MTKVKHGDEVTVHYRGTLTDGTVFDDSSERDPVGFTVGRGEVIKGFEDALIGMRAGEEKTVKIPCGEAYGPRREDLVATVPRSQVPENVEPRPGLRLKLMQPDGNPLFVIVTDVSGEEITIDGNHPLAGQDLTFRIELIAVGA